MNEIAASLEISKTTLYKYFNNKENLFLAAFDYRIEVRQKGIFSLLDEDIEIFASEKFFRYLYQSMTDSLRFSNDVKNLAAKNSELRERITIRNEKVFSRLIGFVETKKSQGIIREELDSDLVAALFISLRDGVSNIPTYGFSFEIALETWFILASKFLETVLVSDRARING
jgi:AcrR family transcriptional regulator